jgi:hypothetical protein
MEPANGRGPHLSGGQALGLVVLGLIGLGLAALAFGFWAVSIDLG